MSTPPVRFGPRDIAVAVLMNTLWGLNIIAAKMAVDTIEPLTAAWLRQVVVLIVCLPFLRLLPGRMRDLLSLGVLTGALFFVAINLSLMVATNVSALAIAGQLGVPFSMLLAVFVLKEKIGPWRIFGVALSLLGVGVLVFDPRVADDLLGIVLMASSSLIWASSSLIQRRLKGVPILTMYAWISLVGTIMLGLIAVTFETDAVFSLGDVPLATFGWVAFSGIGSTLIGHGSMTWLLQRHPISKVTPLTLLAPVISVIAASLFFSTPITPIMILGGVIALLGVAVVSIRSGQAVDEDR